jgi:hypothetical protein
MGMLPLSKMRLREFFNSIDPVRTLATSSLLHHRQAVCVIKGRFHSIRRAAGRDWEEVITGWGILNLALAALVTVNLVWAGWGGEGARGA